MRQLEAPIVSSRLGPEGEAAVRFELAGMSGRTVPLQVCGTGANQRATHSDLGRDQAADTLNDATEPVQADAVAALGLGHLATIPNALAKSAPYQDLSYDPRGVEESTDSLVNEPIEQDLEMIERNV